ncbi:MAG TPA: VWA domain-containing protein [Thermoanaerobaculia bacterium]
MKFVLSLAATLLLPLSLFAQEQPQQQPPQEPAQEVPRLVETVDVRVINVDVVVTDRKGNPVTGLTKDDFIIYENGRPQKVSNFYEVITRADAPEPVIRTEDSPEPKKPEQPEQLKRKIVIFVDNLSLAPFNRNRVFKAMKDFVDETLRPGDQAMVVTWNRSMKVRLPFTSDATQIKQTLDAISGESALGIQLLSDRRQIQSQIREAKRFEEAVIAARGYAQALEHDLRQTVREINALMATLGGVEGKKIMLVTSEGFQMQPGRELFYFIDDIGRERLEWQGVGSTFLESMSFNLSNQIESIAHAANANNITLYTLHAGGLMGYNEGSAENQEPVSASVQQAALSNSTDSLRLMADLTGGLAVVGTNNFSNAFNKIKQDVSSYYSLGYRSGTERVDRRRTLEVTTKNPQYVVRSRRSFVEKSITTEMSDKVIANLFYESASNDLGIIIRTGTPRSQDNGTFLVPLEVLVPMDRLTLLPRGEEYVGSFTFYVVVSDKNGDMSDVQKQTHQVRVPAASMGELKGKHYTYSVDLMMNPGRGKISVGIADDLTTKTGFRTTELVARDLR